MRNEQRADTATTTSDQLAYTVDEACRQLGGIGRTSFYALVSQGDLCIAKIGTRTIITREELQRFLAKRVEGPQTDCMKDTARAARASVSMRKKRRSIEDVEDVAA